MRGARPPRLGRGGIALCILAVACWPALAAERPMTMDELAGSGAAAGRLADYPLPFRASRPAVSTGLTGHRPGIGAGQPSAGRFGWVKGDGLLDASMPRFGILERAYHLGHPENKSAAPWRISFLPPGAAYRPDPERPVRVTWAGATWPALLDLPASAGGTPSVRRASVSYGICLPGVLPEGEGDEWHVDLSGAGPYRYAILPAADGVRVRRVSPGESLYRRGEDGPLADNWIALCGAPAFPDVPLLLALERNPEAIEVEAAGASPVSLRLRYRERAGYLLCLTPFGTRAFRPAETETREFLGRLVSRCRFWSKAALAFITGCEEHYRVEPERDRITVVQHFRYRTLDNEWGSAPIPLAPFPPMLALACERGVRGASLAAGAADLDFPTRFGPLRAVVGATEASYALPIPPTGSRTPLRPRGDERFTEECRRELSVFSRRYPEEAALADLHGFWSRKDRNAVDAGLGMVGKLPLLWAFLSPEEQAVVRQNLREHLADALDDRERLAGTALQQGILRDTAGAGATGPLWFRRKEPYTGEEYLLNFRHPRDAWLKGDQDAYRGIYSDQDWGNGLALYGVTMLALGSGGWDIVRDRWATIEDAFRYFTLMQDWACMAAGTNEAGHDWCDTSCYGGYLAFLQMARHTGNEEAYQRGLYVLAKYAVFRCSLFLFGTYINDCYGARPWMAYHALREVCSVVVTPQEPVRWGNLIYRPDQVRGDDLRIQQGSLYSLVAEGIHSELCDLLYSLLPKQTSEFTALYDRLFPEWCTAETARALAAQHAPAGGVNAYFMALLRIWRPEVEPERLSQELETLEREKVLERHLVVFYRGKAPAILYLKALALTRNDPVWLTQWHGAELRTAEYDRATRQAVVTLAAGPGAEVQLAVARRPARVELDGAALPERKGARPAWGYRQGVLSVRFDAGQTLRVTLGRE